jgi:hypothetical protein
MQNVDFGEPYKFVPKEGPGPGEYEGQDKHTKPKVQFAVIKEDTSPYRRPADKTPEPGQYDNHLTQFGSDLKTTADMGSKYKFVPKEGPPPGMYEQDST